MRRYLGLYTPLITPFKEGKVDLEGLKTLISFQKEHGVDGLVFCATTGEAATLTEQEKNEILKIASKEVLPLPFLVGVGAPSTTRTIDNIKQAQDHGATAALVITPYYNKPTQEGLFQHYEAISKAASIDILVYNIPGRTSVNVDVETLIRIAKLPHVVGVKESAKNLSQLINIIALIKSENPSFSVLTGDDTSLLPALALGADGGIVGSANLIPSQIRTLIQAGLKGDFAHARQLFYSLFPLFEALSIETNPIPLKYAMSKIGLPAGDPRLPLTPLNPNLRKVIDPLLDSLRLLTVAK